MFSPGDPLGPLLPYFVPRAGHQTRSLIVTVLSSQCLQWMHPFWGGQASLTCSGMCTASCCKCMCLPSVPLENSDFQEFAVPQGCYTSVWPYTVKNAFQLVVCLSIFWHFCHWPQEEPIIACLASGSGVTLSTGASAGTKI